MNRTVRAAGGENSIGHVAGDEERVGVAAGGERADQQRLIVEKRPVRIDEKVAALRRVRRAVGGRPKSAEGLGDPQRIETIGVDSHLIGGKPCSFTSSKGTAQVCERSARHRSTLYFPAS